MYWRKSKIDVYNKELDKPLITFDLYMSNDDYAPFIKYDVRAETPGVFCMNPWCVMFPRGTQYGAEIVSRHARFVDAFEMLKSYIELNEGS